MYLRRNDKGADGMILWVNGCIRRREDQCLPGVAGQAAPAAICLIRKRWGDVIRRILPVELWKDNFQDYPLWRSTTAALLQASGRHTAV